MFDDIKRRLGEEFGFLRGNFLILVIGYMLSGFASGLHTPFRSPYIEGLGASVIEIGLISSVGSFLSAIISLPGAYIADRYGRRKIIVVFTYFIAVSYLIHAVAPNWWFIMIGTIIMNLSRVYLPALSAIEADSLPENRRGMGYSLINMAPSVFSGISPPIAGIIVSKYELIPGMRLLYYATTLLILAIALIRTFFLKETLETEPVELTSLADQIKDSVASFKAAYKDMTREIWSFTIIQLLYSLKDPIFMLFLSLFVLQELELSVIEWGFLNSLFLPISLLLGLPAGKFVDKVSRRTSLLLGYIISTPIGIILILSKGFNMVALVFILLSLTQIILFPAVSAWKADIIPIDKRGRILGMISVMQNLVRAFSALVFGLMYQSISPSSVFIAAASIEFISLVVILLSVRQTK